MKTLAEVKSGLYTIRLSYDPMLKTYWVHKLLGSKAVMSLEEADRETAFKLAYKLTKESK